MAGKLSNNASTTLAGSISTSATSFSVPSGQGDLFPVLGAGDYAYITLAKLVGGLEVLEIVKATARAGDVFTVVRAQDGTTARTFTGGDKVELRVTAAIINEKAGLDSPALINAPTAPTQAEADDTTKIATDAFANRAAKTALDKVAGATATIASAATTDIATPGVGNVSITGTTTITALGTAPEGTLRHAVFTGTLTLTHNVTSLQLPGAANILTAAGDSAIFKSLAGGNWKCLFYQRSFDQTVLTTASVASAATTNIGAANSLNVDITGTTTITAFDTVANGTLRYVAFAGALTLTHNASTLQLPGAANIATAAGDTAIFKSYGSGWKCLMFQRASVVPLNYAPVNRTGDTMSGNLTFNNNTGIQVKDSTNVSRQLFNFAADNTLNWTIPGGSAWNVYNQAGGAVVWSLSNAGIVSQKGNLVLENGTAIQSKDGSAVVRSLTYMAGNTVVNLCAGGSAIQWYSQALALIANLSNAGDFTAVTVGQTSDERYKWKWEKSPDDLIERFASMKKVGSFTWKGRHKELGRGLGGGAQSIETFLPDAVATNEDGTKTVQYGPAAFVLSHSLAKEALRSRKQVAKLEADLAKVLARLQKLETA